ncbi:protein kinase [Nannocystis sp.]|uniref:protein kinase domain-containing protein n=1 Tax=Nannocystis sp. TaxID=1962667 RepID=UPI0025FADBA9|nr:protein kinase [Nannocystis sp.]
MLDTLRPAPVRADAVTVHEPGDRPAPSRDPDAELSRGDMIGRHIVLERLGAGGMGVVYAAYDPELDRKIAVKQIRSPGPGTSDEDRASATRLLREAKAMARLTHPNVITVHDVGMLQGGQVFIAMEFVDGLTCAPGSSASRPGARPRRVSPRPAAAWAAHTRPGWSTATSSPNPADFPSEPPTPRNAADLQPGRGRRENRLPWVDPPCLGVTRFLATAWPPPGIASSLAAPDVLIDGEEVLSFGVHRGQRPLEGQRVRPSTRGPSRVRRSDRQHPPEREHASPWGHD